MVMAPAWEDTYSTTFDRQKKMDAQRKRTVDASEKLDKSLAIALAQRRARPARLARLPTPGIIERIIPSIYSPAKDARISEAMRELATFNAAHDARKEYNDELRRSRMLEYEAFRNTGSMMDMLDEAGITKTPRSLIDEVISPAMQLQHTQRLDAQQRMREWRKKNPKMSERERTRRLTRKQKRDKIARERRWDQEKETQKRKLLAEKETQNRKLLASKTRRKSWRAKKEKEAERTARKTKRDKEVNRRRQELINEEEAKKEESRMEGVRMDLEDDGDDGDDEEEEEYNKSINQAAAEATARRADVAAALAPMDDYLPADDDADDDDDDDDIDDEDDVVVDGEIPPTHILKKLLKTINEHKEDDDHDDHEIEINGTPPEERLRAKLQTVLETSTGDGRGRHKSRRHHKKKKKSRRPRKHKNKSTRRRKPKKTKRR
jgi:hypothetical protein